MDQIFISQLRLEAIIGVYPEERLAPQPIVVDLALTVDTDKAVQSDDVADTVDYNALAQKLAQWSADQQYHLIETLADYLAKKILNTYPIQVVRLKLYKFPVGLKAASAGVEIVRKNTK